MGDFWSSQLRPPQLYADPSHHLSPIPCVNSISEDKWIIWPFFLFFFVKNRKWYGMSEKNQLLQLLQKIIKTMLLHCNSNTVLRIFKQLLLLVKWNTVQQPFNSLVPDYQLFQASVKISITGKNELCFLCQTCINMPIKLSWERLFNLTV